MLSTGGCRKTRASDADLLVTTVDDGSGNGLGNTLQINSSECSTSKELEAWLGVWTGSTLRQNLNWEEQASTLNEILRRHRYTGRLHGTHLFYLTDSTNVYQNVQQGVAGTESLQELVLKEKELEVEMDVLVEAAHRLCTNQTRKYQIAGAECF